MTDPHDAEPQCVESSVLLAGHCVGGDGTQATEGLDPVGAVLIHCGLDCVGDLGLDVSLLLCHDFDSSVNKVSTSIRSHQWACCHPDSNQPLHPAAQVWGSRCISAGSVMR